MERLLKAVEDFARRIVDYFGALMNRIVDALVDALTKK